MKYDHEIYNLFKINKNYFHVYYILFFVVIIQDYFYYDIK